MTGPKIIVPQGRRVTLDELSQVDGMQEAALQLLDRGRQGNLAPDIARRESMVAHYHIAMMIFNEMSDPTIIDSIPQALIAHIRGSRS